MANEHEFSETSMKLIVKTITFRRIPDINRFFFPLSFLQTIFINNCVESSSSLTS